MGAITALEALNEPCVVRLTSDSKYLVDAVTKGWLRRGDAADIAVESRTR